MVEKSREIAIDKEWKKKIVKSQKYKKFVIWRDWKKNRQITTTKEKSVIFANIWRKKSSNTFTRLEKINRQITTT